MSQYAKPVYRARRADGQHGILWQSGCPTPMDPALDAVIAVGNVEQPWVEEWFAARASQFKGAAAPSLPVRVYAPLVDSPGCLDAPVAEAVVLLAVRLLRDGRQVLVHCDMGAFRSVHVSAAIVARLEGMPGDSAFRYVDMQRGMRDPRSSLTLGGWHEHVATFGDDW